MTKMRSICIVMLLVAAQAKAQQPQREAPYIEVSGTAEREVTPDELYMAITLTERYDGKNKITIDDQEKQLRDKLRQLGLDAASLSLSDADAAYVKIKHHDKDVMASKHYLLKVGNAAMAGRVFDALEDISISDAAIDHVEYAQKEQLKKELRIEAIKAAKDKAVYLLSAIGQVPGKPLYVGEQETYPVYPMMANVRRKSLDIPASAPENSDDDVAFKKIKFSATVNAKFEIK